MSSILDQNLIEFFEIPVVYLDGALTLVEVNDRFKALFGDVLGQTIDALSDDFKPKKFARKVTTSAGYSFIVVPEGERRMQYTLLLKPYGEGYIGFATDTYAAAKTEAMLESYSDLIEKQNREIKAKTAEVNKWRSRIQNELEQAAAVQDLLVAKHIALPSLEARCEQLQELSGDFHELAEHEDGTLTFITGDVAGKGIYAAIMLAQTLTAFRASYARASLSEVAYEIVAMLDGRFPDGLFVALTLVRQSADKATVRVLNLGNPDAVMMEGNEVIALVPSAGPAIGILPAEIYAGLDDTALNLTGKSLYVFSDGVLEANLGPDHDEFADSRAVGQYLARMDEDGNALTTLIDTVRANKQADDVTIACFKNP